MPTRVGSFTELLHLGGHGQVSVNVSRPHITKGEHWHHTKHEKFVVLSGEGVIRFRKPGDATVISYRVSGDAPQVVDIPPGYTHNIENTGDTDMITLMWANECFDPARPDTIRLPVEAAKGGSKMTRKLKLMTVLGTRPEIIRLSAVMRCADRYFDHVVVHTGQNYDPALNEVFFRELGLRNPDFYLDAVGADLGETMGNIIAQELQGDGARAARRRAHFGRYQLRPVSHLRQAAEDSRSFTWRRATAAGTGT